MKKRVIVFFMALVMIVSFAGCNMISVNEDRDGELIIATVNDEPIYKKTIINDAKLYLTQIGYSEETSDYDLVFSSVMEQLLDAEINNVVSRQMCEKFGVELITAEQQAELDTYKSALYDNIVSLSNQNYSEEDYPDEDERKKLVDEYVEKTLTDMGYYDGSYDKSYKQSYMIKNLKDYLSKDYDPNDDEVKAFYDQQIEDQKAIFESSMTQFDTIESSGILVYVPENVRNVRNLLIALPDDVKSEITSLRNSGDDESADALRDEELAKIKDEADEAYAAAKNDFMAALEKYGDDPGMKEEADAEKGYRLHEGIYNFDSVFKDAGMALKSVGDISEPIASDNGYYIIEYASVMESGVIDYNEVKEDLREYMIDKNLTETYDVNLGLWLEDSEIVRFPKKLKYKG